MKRIVALLLVAICVVSFVGCSGGSVATGVYKLESFMGMDIDAANELYGANGGEGSIDELFILELKSGNKAVFTIQGERLSWITKSAVIPLPYLVRASPSAERSKTAKLLCQSRVLN